MRLPLHMLDHLPDLLHRAVREFHDLPLIMGQRLVIARLLNPFRPLIAAGERQRRTPPHLDAVAQEIECIGLRRRAVDVVCDVLPDIRIADRPVFTAWDPAGNLLPFGSLVDDQQRGFGLAAFVMPQPSNPPMSRVTILAPLARAMAAIMRSCGAIGRPPRVRAAKISA